MEGKILLEVFTPERLVVSEEASVVTAPGEEGVFGALPGHTPFMTILKPGEVEYGKGGVSKHILVNKGFAEVTANSVCILVESAEKAEQIDIKRAQAAQERAEERIKKRDKEPIDFARAQAALTRALARLQVASKI